MHTTAVWQNGGFSAKFKFGSSIELLCKTEDLCFDFRHYAKPETVSGSLRTTHKQEMTSTEIEEIIKTELQVEPDLTNVFGLDLTKCLIKPK